MRYSGHINAIKGKHIELELDDKLDIEQARRLAENGKIKIKLSIVDTRMITLDQQKLLYSLFREHSEWSGYTVEYSKQLLKRMYANERHIVSDMSLSSENMTRERARDFIDYIIEYFFHEEIPFKFKDFAKYGSDSTRTLFILLKYRVCFVCGKRGEIHHVDTVGMGHNRRKIDHTKHRLLCLCRKHHTESHSMPQQTFIEKHHLVPIKLNEQQVKDFKINK